MWTGPPCPVVQIASPSLPAAPHIVVYMMSIRPSVCAVAAHFKQAGHDVSALRYVVVEYVNSHMATGWPWEKASSERDLLDLLSEHNVSKRLKWGVWCKAISGKYIGCVVCVYWIWYLNQLGVIGLLHVRVVGMTEANASSMLKEVRILTGAYKACTFLPSINCVYDYAFFSF